VDYQCLECGYEFSEPEKKNYAEDLDGEGFKEFWGLDVCTFCKSEDIFEEE